MDFKYIDIKKHDPKRTYKGDGNYIKTHKQREIKNRKQYNTV